MKMNRVDRERLQDSRLRIQSVVNALSGVDPEKVPQYKEIHECLRDAEKSIEIALRSAADAEKA